MTINVRLLAILAFGLATITSCKKKTDDSVKAKLTGAWKGIKHANDINNNGTMDASEIVVLTDSISEVMTFNSDGTGSLVWTIEDSPTIQTMTWKLINGDRDFVATLSFSGNTYSDTAHIENLTSSDLEISGKFVNGGGVKSWAYLHRR